MTEEEKEAWLKQIDLIKDTTEILKQDNEEYLINKYVDEHEEEIYNAYCESRPVNSDFEFEDIDDEWIIEYAKDRI